MANSSGSFRESELSAFRALHIGINETTEEHTVALGPWPFFRPIATIFVPEHHDVKFVIEPICHLKSVLMDLCDEVRKDWTEEEPKAAICTTV